MKHTNNKPSIHKTQDAQDKVGIESIGEGIELHFPGSFRIEDDERLFKKDALEFLKSLSIANSINQTELLGNENHGDAWPIESYIWLVKDYFENDIYYNREKVYSRSNQGKNAWKQILKQPPIVSNGNLIFDKMITSKMVASNDIISHTYKICLKICSERIGWLVGLNHFEPVLPLYPVKQMIHFVKIELANTFDDIKKLRFKHMLKILEGISDKGLISLDFNNTITNYYYVYEQMIDRLFHGVVSKEKKEYNPSGHWQLVYKKNSIEASNLRPDTISVFDDKIYIIDAKMYKFGYTGNEKDLPETSSMQKQITYGDYVVQHKANGKPVRNVFIIPYDKTLSCFENKGEDLTDGNRNLVYLGYAFGNWRKENKVFDHDYIYTFLIDFNYLLRNYRLNRTDDLARISKKIESLIIK